MLDRLEKLLEEVSDLQNRLLLLVGPAGVGKTELLRSLGERRGTVPVHLGAVLGRRLLGLSQRQRHLRAGSLFREIADTHAPNEPLLLDNIELLFDASLKLNPLELLRQRGHARRVVAVWPGELRAGRLTYARMSHPEHQDYPALGLVVLEVQR